ncbi:DUF58 domain-containing protein [Shewanella sp. SG44-6]|jgi:uncharacterized protein (DUF58 family)|uniref:DUF58 domain-containing protein n=1 Tax=Shewanella sp. SG44-6 TaxID=2760959 RepID=UPI001604682D|nr:DUF58 domain-containing protein [Shewanella sp. SG44-6]MBB1390929.1 DUF58 domain-containing protein [Shewanella sp. SG44-6]
MMNQTYSLPLYSDGMSLNEQELIACQSLSRALPDHKSRAKAALSGHRSSQIKGRGMEFAEVRHYQNGDDVRTIDWRVTARTGVAHTKLFVEERERPILLLIDLSHSSYFGSQLLLQSVQIAHLATTLGWNAINNGDRLGALIASETNHLELKPRSRRQGILQLTSGLIDVHQQQLKQINQLSPDPGHMFKACQRLQRIAKPGSLIWIITDGQHINQQCLAPLTELSRHCDIGAFVVTDPLRQGTLALPKQFALPVRDGQQQLTLTRQSYEAWLANQQAQQQQFFALMNLIKVQPKLIDAAKPLCAQLDILR